MYAIKHSQQQSQQNIKYQISIFNIFEIESMVMYQNTYT